MEEKKARWTWEQRNSYYEGNYHAGSIKFDEFFVFSVIDDFGEAFGLGMHDVAPVVEAVVKVLNRELPDGKPRNRRKKVSE